MKRLSPAETASLVQQHAILSFFDTPNLPFQAFSYQKGEILSSPLNPLEHLLILVQGSVRIYLLQDDGWSQVIVPETGAGPCGKLFGDLEFACGTVTPFFSEAMEETVCIALSLTECGEQLHRDVTFLHHVMRSMADKLEYTTSTGIGSTTLEDRLTALFRAVPDGILEDVEVCAQRLHCSRRQLQRVLKKLCEEGQVERTGRGQYRLAEELP